MSGKRQRLEAEIERALGEWCDFPFVWGSADCILSPATIVLRARGYDFAQGYRNRYSTRIGALRITAPDGGIVAAFHAAMARHGCHPIKRYRAATGDLGITLTPRLSCVIRFRGAWIGRTETGFGRVPDKHIAHAFRVA